MESPLIGGPRDGERLEMRGDRDWVEVAVLPTAGPKLYRADSEPDPHGQAVCKTFYRRQEWRDGDRRYVVWVHEDEDDPMARLLAGYHPGPPRITMESQPCPICHGQGCVQVFRGDVFLEERPCDYCHSTGYVERPR